MKNLIINSFFIFLLINLINGQFLKIDTFQSATCEGSPSYSTHYILLNRCNGNYIYKFVSGDVGGPTTTTSTAGSGIITNAITTAGTLSTVDITSIVTQAVTLGMTTSGSGILTAAAPDLNVNNLQQNVNSEVQTAESQTTDGGNGAQTTTNVPTETSNGAQTTSTGTVQTTNSNPQTTSGLNTLSGLSTLSGQTTIPGITQGVTQVITNIISSSLTTGTNTGNVQTGAGKVVQYYCLSVGCGSQCVSLVEYPLGTCTKLGLDNVIYSLANETNLVMKADNTTSPDSNGFCQSFVTPNSACLSSSFSDVTQFKNDYCGKGLKINCTSTKYNSYTCIDTNCDDCVLLKQYDLGKCIIQNSTGTIFKSVLKTNISDPVTLPPLSSESTDLSLSSHHSSVALPLALNFNYILFLINISIILIILF